MTTGIFASIIFLFFTYQDFKYRHINGWLLFPLSILLLINSEQITNDSTFLFYNILCNVIFLITQFLLISMYFFLKEHKWSIIDSKLGIGDILLFLVLCLGFSFKSFIIFYIITLLLSLIISIIIICKNKGHTIALAGYASLIWMIWWIYSVVTKTNIFFK